MTEQAFVQYGIAGAVIVVVLLFLNHLKNKAEQDAKERQAEREDRAIARQEFEATITKVASEHTCAMDKNTAVLVRLQEIIQHCPGWNGNVKGDTT